MNRNWDKIYLWEKGLQMPTSLKRNRARPADGSVWRHLVQHPNLLWVMDYQFECTTDGSRLNFLYVMSNHLSLNLADRMGRSYSAMDVVEMLELTIVSPAPGFSCSENSSVFIVQDIRNWYAASGTASMLYIMHATTCKNRSSNRSMADLEMSSSTRSCFQRAQRPISWLTICAESTTHRGRTPPFRG